MKVAQIMTPTPITVDVGASLAKATHTMTELEIRHLPVMREGRVVGVVSDRDLLESTGWMWNEERGKAPVCVEDIIDSEPPVTVSPDESVSHLATRLVEWGVGCAPVVENGELRGIATEIDVLVAYAVASQRHASATGVKVEEKMTTELLTLDAAQTASDAMELMRGSHIRHLPVVGELEVVGMVSDRDLRAIVGRALPADTPVSDFMSVHVQAAAPEDDLSTAARTMAELKIGGLPVVDRGGLIGLITITDVLVHCADAIP